MYCNVCSAETSDLCCCVKHLVYDGKPKKPLLGIIFDLHDDLENGEHVDNQWVKDSFELQGYMISSNEHYWGLQNDRFELEKQLSEAVTIIEHIGNSHTHPGWWVRRHSFLEKLEKENRDGGK